MINNAEFFTFDMMEKQGGVNFFWFRRDLRLIDNVGLFHACKIGNVIPLFIFDEHILDELMPDDPRVNFIYQELEKMQNELVKNGRSLLVKKGKPLGVWKELCAEYQIQHVFANRDFEPYGIQRDKEVETLLTEHSVTFNLHTDHILFEPTAILKDDGTPYTIYTPYKNKWLRNFDFDAIKPFPKVDFTRLKAFSAPFPTLQSIGFSESEIRVLPFDTQPISEYHLNRDFPSLPGTTKLGPHLRFGTVGIRTLVKNEGPKNATFLSEIIWREFFIQILFHFPKVVNHSFKAKYDRIKWLNDEVLFEKWQQGKTGYPMVDAGMRELNATGYMHNRVRMVVASFLCKHLLIDWRFGEAYFAQKLLDYELASNNGNWQWASGTGCDAAPYFRVFNPAEQLRKFDGKMEYIKKWIPELMSGNYVAPIVDHASARLRAIEVYKKGLAEH